MDIIYEKQKQQGYSLVELMEKFIEQNLREEKRKTLKRKRDQYDDYTL